MITKTRSAMTACVLGLLLAPAIAIASGARHRVIVSTDIGGTDFDDFQSMIHLLLYADTLAIEGIVSSPFGDGRKSDILDILEIYRADYPKLKSHSAKYPSPDSLRLLSKQGALATPGPLGFASPTEGSKWIVECARRPDPRPLHVLVWGGIEDVAQALHDAPEIVSKIRVYYIGGPNKKWSPDAFQYLATHHRKLWIIEANSTYRGWFVGGNQSGEWGNSAFVANSIAPHGAMGKYFATRTSPTVKMGDSPSVGWLLKGDPTDPTSKGWGGTFVRAWARPHSIFTRLTTTSDRMEQFGILDLRLPFDGVANKSATARMSIGNQTLMGYLLAPDTMQFLFCPKDATSGNTYTITSSVPSLDGKKGAINSFAPSASNKGKPAPDLPNWWTDDPSENLAEGGHQGIKTLNTFREAFLGDFAKRLKRLDGFNTSATSGRPFQASLRLHRISNSTLGVSIETSGDVPGTARAEIVDLSGIPMLAVDLPGNHGVRRIDIGAIPAGAHLLVVRTPHDTYSTKFVKTGWTP
jgi:hypothetical protein